MEITDIRNEKVKFDLKDVCFCYHQFNPQLTQNEYRVYLKNGDIIFVRKHTFEMIKDLTK